MSEQYFYTFFENCYLLKTSEDFFILSIAAQQSANCHRIQFIADTLLDKL